VLQRIVYFIILAPHDNEQYDLLHRIKADNRYKDLGCESQLLRLFTLHELMRWPIVSKQFAPYLCRTDIFAETEEAAAVDGDRKALQRWQDLRKRVIEHNVRVVAKYYTRIHTSRLTELLDLNEDETEKYISELVTGKTIYARIDRPAGVISFTKPRDANDVLNEWSADMKSLLGLFERIDHLITKEGMMARIKPSKAESGKGKKSASAKD
jgi:26S proteasome regulatory subunit N5